MKQISILLLSVLMALSIAACGCRNSNAPTVPPTILPEMTTPILPEMDPTLDTNIPDPSINEDIPTYTDGTDPSDAK